MSINITPWYTRSSYLPTSQTLKPSFMEAKGVIILFTLLCLVSGGWTRPQWVNWDNDDKGASSSVLNVMDFGAAGDGKSDDSQAFLKAWDAACQSSSPTLKLLVPSEREFLLSPLSFEGPCNTSITFQLSGNLTAPDNVSMFKNQDRWIEFDKVDGVIFTGSGYIDGKGSVWWDCREKHRCSGAPTGLSISGCTNFQMNGVTLLNSPGMHLALESSTGINVSKIKIIAPEDSPNTDGIHIQGSTQVLVSDSVIGTGDDCISIGTNSSNVNISQIICGPGHGISIGSLGKDEHYEVVEDIHVFNCTLRNTMNGVRIKTWQGGSGYARGIKFENISIFSSDNPIIIDQYYPDSDRKNKTSAVKISDISFLNVNGTTSKDHTAIKLACSQSVGCSNIVLKNVHISSMEADSEVNSYCLSVDGEADDVNPAVPCLS